MNREVYIEFMYILVGLPHSYKEISLKFHKEKRSKIRWHIKYEKKKWTYDIPLVVYTIWIQHLHRHNQPTTEKEMVRK